MKINTTCINNTYIDHSHIIPLSVHITTAISITFFNAVVIFLYISMKKRRRTITNYLMFSQALVDMYQAAITWYETAVDILDENNSFGSAINEVTYSALFEYSLSLCLLTLMLASVERYLCITKPFFHRKFVTKTRIIYGSLIVWATAILAPLCLLLVAQFDHKNLNSSAVILYSYIFDGLLFVLIVAIITTLALSLKAGKSSMNASINTQRQHYTDESDERLECFITKKVRLVVIFSSMMGVFLISYLPFAIGRFLNDAGLLNGIPLPHQYQLLVSCHIIYKSSSLLNPILTLSMKCDYQKLLVNKLKRENAHEECDRIRNKTDAVD